jgi:ABC-type spermidine/putrescine transport system permease subunit II
MVDVYLVSGVFVAFLALAAPFFVEAFFSFSGLSFLQTSQDVEDSFSPQQASEFFEDSFSLQQLVSVTGFGVAFFGCS